MTEHTPLPWKQTYNRKFGRHVIRHTEVVAKGDSNEIAVIYTSLDSNLDKANAQFIARACNSHYDLLKACHSSCELCQMMHSGKADCKPCVIGKAIAKAEEL